MYSLVLLFQLELWVDNVEQMMNLSFDFAVVVVVVVLKFQFFETDLVV